MNRMFQAISDPWNQDVLENQAICCHSLQQFLILRFPGLLEVQHLEFFRVLYLLTTIFLPLIPNLVLMLLLKCFSHMDEATCNGSWCNKEVVWDRWFLSCCKAADKNPALPVQSHNAHVFCCFHHCCFHCHVQGFDLVISNFWVTAFKQV